MTLKVVHPYRVTLYCHVLRSTQSYTYHDRKSKKKSRNLHIYTHKKYYIHTYRCLDDVHLAEDQLYDIDLRESLSISQSSEKHFLSPLRHVTPIEQKLFRIMLSTICNFHFYAKRPHKGVTEWPLKYSFLNISKTIENF